MADLLGIDRLADRHRGQLWPKRWLLPDDGVGCTAQRDLDQVDSPAANALHLADARDSYLGSMSRSTTRQCGTGHGLASLRRACGAFAARQSYARGRPCVGAASDCS